MEDVKNTEEEIIVPPIGEKEIRKADETLKKYKTGKKNLENRVVENEKWWKLQGEKAQGISNDFESSSAWLFNCIVSKHADSIDAYPEPNILPREQGDVEEAKRLSSILPVVLKYNKFLNTYSKVSWAKIKSGTGIYGIFWDKSKLNGLGDIAIEKIDILNLFWEPGKTEIQDSKNIFYVSLADIEDIEAAYPFMKDKIKPNEAVIKEYAYEDNVDTKNKALIVDWYYKKYDLATRRTVVHYVKYCNETLLFSSENDKNYSRGFYEHGKYPFVVDNLFPQEGSPAGFGYIDICKNPQKYIDSLDKAILDNALAGSTARWFVRDDANVNVEEYLNFGNPIVKVAGAGSPSDSVMPIPTQGLPSIYYQVLQGKIDELKETSGNRDVNNGGTPSGVTAASAIAAMQEQSGKLSRDANKMSYEKFEELIEICIELIRQFYNLERQFRIIGESGREEFISYSNANIKPQVQPISIDGSKGYRVPVFDVDVTAQKENLYTKTAYNEFALQMYQNGFFNPDMASQALAALNIMDFKGKERVKEDIERNYTLQQQLIQWQQMAITLAAKYEPQIANGLASSLTGQIMPTGADEADIKNVEAKEDARVANARGTAQERTKPR